jgi:hypothetical protein
MRFGLRPVIRALLLVSSTPALATADPPTVADAGVPNTVPPVAAASPEPSVGEVVQYARRAARTLGPAHVRELARRARLRGLVPQLRLGADRGLRQNLSSTTTVQTREIEAIGDDLSFSASLTFDLDRLVFAGEEVRLLSIARWLEADLRKLIAEVVRLYFQRRRLVREQASAAVPDPELADAIRETTALLDAYTDGAFSRGD